MDLAVIIPELRCESARAFGQLKRVPLSVCCGTMLPTHARNTAAPVLREWHTMRRDCSARADATTGQRFLGLIGIMHGAWPVAATSGGNSSVTGANDSSSSHFRRLKK